MSITSLDDETAKKVLCQVEFYFGDSNLPGDKFLMKSITESEDGMLNIALICSFSRMRSHLNLGDVKPEGVSEETVQAVAQVLRRLSSSLKISEDGKKVGRTTKILKPEEMIEQSEGRTIAASPLAFDVNLEELESFFAQFAKVNSVRLPRHVANKKVFCGTALIEFATEEEAEKVLKQTIEYAGVELELKNKKSFDAKREKEAAEVDKHPTDTVPNCSKNSNDRANDYPKGLIVAFSLKSLSVGGSEGQNGNTERTNDKVCTETLQISESGDDVKQAHEGNIEITAKSPIISVGEENADGSIQNDEGKKNEDGSIKKDESKAALEARGDEKTALRTEGKENEDESVQNDKEKIISEERDDDNHGSRSYIALKSEGTENGDASIGRDEEGDPSDKKFDTAACKDDRNIIMREDLKEVFRKFGTVKFVDFKIGENSGYIRFDAPEAAQKARAAAVLAEEGGLVVKNFVASLEPVTGDSEREYWNQMRASQDRVRGNGFNNRGRGRYGGRGGRQVRGKQGRHWENNDSSFNRGSKSRKVGEA